MIFQPPEWPRIVTSLRSSARRNPSRSLANDPRGHGESDKPEGGYNYHTLAKDLDGFLRALDLSDVTILGHSGGCKVILTYLELYGDSRLRAIVFSDDSPCHLRDGIFSAA